MWERSQSWAPEPLTSGGLVSHLTSCDLTTRCQRLQASAYSLTNRTNTESRELPQDGLREAGMRSGSERVSEGFNISPATWARVSPSLRREEEGAPREPGWAGLWLMGLQQKSKDFQDSATTKASRERRHAHFSGANPTRALLFKLEKKESTKQQNKKISLCSFNSWVFVLCFICPKSLLQDLLPSPIPLTKSSD